MKQLLKQIANNAEPKRSFLVVVSDNKTRFKEWFKTSHSTTHKER